MARKFTREITQAWQRRRDSRRGTVIDDEAFAESIAAGGLSIDEFLEFPARFLDHAQIAEALAGVESQDGRSGAVAQRAADHTFDLLASGPVRVGYETEAAGAFGARYDMRPGREAEGRQLARMGVLLDSAARFVGDDTGQYRTMRMRLDGSTSPYRPIDWHTDFKSGYRWSPDRWWADVTISPAHGADIKVPWELSRSHHLVALALDAAYGVQPDERTAEISLQILDWIAANPPRFGVNWRVSMEVAVRASNWLWSLALLHGRPGGVPPSMRWLAGKSLYQHADFVWGHLDYTDTGTHNHYLAEIVGLQNLALAFFELPGGPAWTAFSLQELVSEMGRTVHDDGSNYEGSTGYHRLVTEMFLHGTAVSMRIPRARRIMARNSKSLRRHDPQVAPARWSFNPADPAVFPAWYWRRLKAMVAFTAALVKPDGLVPQIGDQDAGRFVKFTPPGPGEIPSVSEESRDHRHLLAAGGALFNQPAWIQAGKPNALDGRLMTAGIDTTDIPSAGSSEPACQNTVRHSSRGCSTTWFPDAGVCILRSESMWVAAICRPSDDFAPSGHRHADQLSFDLNVGGRDFIVDPGSGVYTADPESRNNFRSATQHNAVQIDGLPGDALGTGVSGLFTLPDAGWSATGISTGPDHFTAKQSGHGISITRTFRVTDSSLVIQDELKIPRESCATLVIHPDVVITDSGRTNTIILERDSIRIEIICSEPDTVVLKQPAYFSPHYGLVVQTTRLVITRTTRTASIRFQLL